MSQVNEGIKTFTSGEILAANRRVKLSSGTVVYADAYDKSIGITVAPAVASGDPVAVKLHGFPGTRQVTASEAITSGAALYGAADGKVTDTYAGGGELVGVALEAGTGDGSVLEVLPEEGGSKMLYNIAVQSDAGGTSTDSEFTFSNGSVVIPAGQIRVGDLLRIKLQGILPATNSTDTFKPRLYINTELIKEAGAAPDAVNDDVFGIEADVVVREVSATGKLVAHGSHYCDAAAAGLAAPFATAELAEDISGDITIAVKGLFSASSSGNEARLRQFSVERIRR